MLLESKKSIKQRMFYVLTSSYFMVISCQEQHSKHSTGGITKPDDVMVATSIFQIQSIDLIDICLNVHNSNINWKKQNKTSGLL